MTYREPDRSRCTIESSFFPLTGLPDAYTLHFNWWEYRGRFVRWSIAVWQDDPPVSIARIDTCDGEIHRHALQPDGSEARLVYEKIPDQGWDFVDAAYLVYWDRAMSEWAEWVRRWQQ